MLLQSFWNRLYVTFVFWIISTWLRLDIRILEEARRQGSEEQTISHISTNEQRIKAQAQWQTQEQDSNTWLNLFYTGETSRHISTHTFHCENGPNASISASTRGLMSLWKQPDISISTRINLFSFLVLALMLASNPFSQLHKGSSACACACVASENKARVVLDTLFFSSACFCVSSQA